MLITRTAEGRTTWVTMRDRYRMYHRNGGKFYVKNRKTGQSISVATSDRRGANRLLAAKNRAVE